jgi:deoxyadenosine/deoxycytidine kinase
MKTKVNRTIETVETVETEVDFPKYTMDDFFYYKHYSFNHCVTISIINSFASLSVTHNNNGKNLFDEEITEDVFYHAMERVSAMLMPELQVKLEEE